MKRILSFALAATLSSTVFATTDGSNMMQENFLKRLPVLEMQPSETPTKIHNREIEGIIVDIKIFDTKNGSGQIQLESRQRISLVDDPSIEISSTNPKFNHTTVPIVMMNSSTYIKSIAASENSNEKSIALTPHTANDGFNQFLTVLEENDRLAISDEGVNLHVLLEVIQPTVSTIETPHGNVTFIKEVNKLFETDLYVPKDTEVAIAVSPTKYMLIKYDEIKR